MIAEYKILNTLGCLSLLTLSSYVNAQEGGSFLDETIIESAPVRVAPSPAPAVPAPTVEQRAAAPTPPVVLAPAYEPAPVVRPVEVATTVATRTPQILVPSTDTTSVSEIRKFQRVDLNDTLRRTPGVSLTQNGGLGTLTGFRIRGLESDQNLVLLNGRRLPPGLAGQYQLELTDVSTLESVQILRGSASSIYGSEAIGGVIDLQSTDARFVETGGVSFYTEAGSFDTFRAGGVVTFREDRIGGSFEASTVTTDGDRPLSEFENKTLRGNIAYDIGDNAWFDVLGLVQSSELQVPGSSLGFGFPASELNNNDSFLISPRFTIERDKWDASVFYSYSENELEALNSAFFNDNFLRQEGRETEAVINYRPNRSTALTLGGGTYDYEFTQQPLGDFSFAQDTGREFGYNSVFGQAQFELPGQIEVLTSVRHDDHDTFDDATTYSVALEKGIEKTGSTIFGKISTGYRAPTGQDLLFLIGDIDSLSPEESESWEIGIRQPLGEKAELTVTYFNNEFINSPSSNPFTFVPQNVDADTSGFEFEFNFQPYEGLEFYANYTNLDTEVTGGGGFIAGSPGDRLPLRPRHTFNAGLVLSGDKWSVGAEVHGVADRRDVGQFLVPPPFLLEDYATVRIFGSYDISDRLEVYGRVENLFDEEFVFTRGFEAPGVGVYGGLRVNIGK